jgi:hypothetical protein
MDERRIFLAFRHEEFGRNINGVMLIGYERAFGAAEPSTTVAHQFASHDSAHDRPPLGGGVASASA